MNNQKPRIWLSNSNPTKGEIVKVRAVIVHRMETGLRLNHDGEALTRNIINSFTATFNEQLLFAWQPETAIAQNPYLEFTFKARESGTLTMRWEDDEGKIITSDTEITIN
ncbi:thiosulfate oxidation carrier complex protein SoxZ [Oligella ureolytica]|jgi:sulfur-oxidizing protein SoxZ|nr:thiosulfate oxidation carrier complex protein SoxZ [Alcaligenaceae bacterium]HZJ97697.1 thiosulfate oxidation carrier complex protein SoxZ [Oligella sp.]